MEMLMHYSKERNLVVESTSQSRPETGKYKPRGLWAWVEELDHIRSFSLTFTTYVHQIILDPNARILLLSTSAETSTMDWAEVAKEYQGCVAPYKMSLRMVGCIWDAAAVEKTRVALIHYAMVEAPSISS
jgi:hypothetical protein